jgi:nuclear transport factor 2 (NTF2) superfamily protein
MGVYDNRIAVRYAYEWHDDSVTGSALTATKTGNLKPMA